MNWSKLGLVVRGYPQAPVDKICLVKNDHLESSSVWTNRFETSSWRNGKQK